MLSRVYTCKLLVLLLSTIYRASCASLQKACVPCALSCDDAHELKQHDRVRVEVEHQSVRVLEETQPVSSLWKDGSCSVVVPDCSKWDKSTKFVLRFYADNDDDVSDPFYHKTLSMPDCVVSSIAPIKGDSDGTLSNKLLILLLVCLCMFYYFKGPRCTARSSGSCSSGKKGSYYQL